MGGQGKTELCKQFIHQNTSPSPSFITWLHGDSYQQLSSSIQNLAQFLTLSIIDASGKPLQIKQQILQISTHFKNLCPSNAIWLIIIDNVDEEYPSEFEEILNLLINLVEIQSFVLITSRRNNIFPGYIQQLRLQTMTPTDAHLLVKNILSNSSDDDISILCETLGNHALALQQASAFILQKQHTTIKGSSYSIQDYVVEFKGSQETILQHPIKFSNYDKTIHSIVQTTLVAIRGNDIPEQSTGRAWREEIGIILGLIHPDGIHIETSHKLVQTLKKAFIDSENQSYADWTEENTEVAVTSQIFPHKCEQ
jgi:hypothetical protein